MKRLLIEVFGFATGLSCTVLFFLVMVVAFFNDYVVALNFNSVGEFNFEIVLLGVGIVAQVMSLYYWVRRKPKKFYDGT